MDAYTDSHDGFRAGEQRSELTTATAVRLPSVGACLEIFALTISRRSSLLLDGHLDLNPAGLLKG